MATVKDGNARFASLDELSREHVRLLRQELEGSGQGQKIFFAAVKPFLYKGRATGALLSDPQERRAAQNLLNYWVTVMFRAKHEVEEASQNAVLAPYDPLIAEQDLSGVACPYVGLRPFREEEYDKFCGREKLTRGIIDLLGKRRLVVIIGPSGSGKSSLLRAGLLHALRGEGFTLEGREWRSHLLHTPGAEPLAAMRRMSQAFTGRASAVADSGAEEFLTNENHLSELLSAGGGTPFILLVDQFEDVFLLCKKQEECDAFIANLLSLINADGTPHRVVLAVRSDCVKYILAHPVLGPLLDEAEERITPLGEDEIRRAVEEPAASVGLIVRPGVVEQINKEIFGDISGLPLLQFTLLRLWEEKEHGAIDVAALRRLGNCRQALARGAEDFYETLEAAGREKLGHLILLRMVRLSDGLDVMSRTVSRQELYEAFGNEDEIDAILEGLELSHLLRVSRETGLEEAAGDESEAGATRHLADKFELAHESLVNYWPRLLQWVKDERYALVTQQRLEEYVAEWLRLRKSRAGLLDEVQTKEAEQWLNSSAAKTLGYNELLPELVAESQKAVESERLEKEKRQQQLLDKEHQRALAASRASRRLIYILGVLTVGVVGVVWLWLAEAQQRKRAESNKLATQALLQADKKPDVALLLNLQAVSVYNEKGSEARQTLNELLSAPTRKGLKKFLYGQDSGIGNLAYRTDGTLISLGGDGKLLTWNLNDPLKPSRSTTGGDSGQQVEGVLSADGQRVLLKSNPGDRKTMFTVWDTVASGQVGDPVTYDQPVSAYAFGPDGKSLAIAVGTELYIRSLDSNSVPRLLRSGNPISALCFSQDGRGLAAGVEGGAKDGDEKEGKAGDENFILVWGDVKAGAAPTTLANPGRIDPIIKLAFSPDGSKLISADQGNYIRLWSTDGKDKDQAGKGLRINRTDVIALAFAPQQMGEEAVCAWGDSGGYVHIGRRLSTSKPDITDMNNVRAVGSIAFSPDGKTLAVGSKAEGENTITLWDSSGSAEQPAEEADLNSLVARACGIVGRNLTLEEWNKSVRNSENDSLNKPEYERTCANYPSGQKAPVDAPVAQY